MPWNNRAERRLRAVDEERARALSRVYAATTDGATSFSRFCPSAPDLAPNTSSWSRSQERFDTPSAFYARAYYLLSSRSFSICIALYCPSLALILLHFLFIASRYIYNLSELTLCFGSSLRRPLTFSRLIFPTEDALVDPKPLKF